MLLPIYGETPVDVLIRACRDEEGFGQWLFGVRPYAHYVDGRHSEKRDALWDLFWFVDEVGDAYRATLGDVECLIAHGNVDEDDRMFLRGPVGVSHPRARDEFKAWHDERHERMLALFQQARVAWIRRVAKKRAGANVRSLNHSCMSQIEAIVPWPEGAGVYFVRAGDRIKIGKAKNIARRLAALQTGCPAPLELWATAEGSFAEEKRFHQNLAKYRVRGEWFLIDDFILGLVATVRALPDIIAVADGAAPKGRYPP